MGTSGLEVLQRKNRAGEHAEGGSVSQEQQATLLSSRPGLGERVVEL